MPSAVPRSIAILNMLGDSSFNAYTFGLAEGLGQQGLRVHLYTCGEDVILAELPQPTFHTRSNVIGAFLFRQTRTPPQRDTVLAPHAHRAPAKTPTVRPPSLGRRLWTRARRHLMTHELLWHLRRQGHHVVWTQWPDMDPYLPSFWRWAKRYGFHTAHTVHNVLPHEVRPGDREAAQAVYEQADLLFVHSEQSERRLRQEFPQLDPAKIFRYPLGLYTMFPRDTSQRRVVRERLQVAPDQPMLLACGLIRPYKNVDFILRVMADEAFDGTVLTISGREAGFPDADPQDPLRRTRQLVEELGLSSRVRLIPGFLPVPEMSGLFEAADALLLPYKEGYGSALLLMGMTFGKHVLTTPVGGAEEYLAHYPFHTVVKEATQEQLRVALQQTLTKLRPAEPLPEVDLTIFRWETIGRQIEKAFAARFDHAR